MDSESFRYVLSVILVFLIWCAYCYIEGVREAYYYHSALISGDSTKYNIHWLYTQQRLIVLSLIYCVLEASLTSIVAIFSFVYIFPFVHDGAYYSKRNDLNPLLYSKRFKADSLTSTAKLEIKYRGRVWMFIIGISLFVGTAIYTLLK